MLNIREPWRQIDLNLLYTFQVFAKQGSVGGTATHLGRSQPAISARLHQLERDLGARLLERRGRRLVLTPLGRVFESRLDSLLADVQGLLDQARASSQVPTGVLRIGALPTTGVYILAPCISEFCAGYREVDVEVSYALVSDQLQALHAGTLDLIVGVGDPPAGALSVIPLGRAAPVLVSARSSGLRSGAPLPVARIAALPWVGFGRIGDAFFDAVWAFLERHDIRQQVRVRVSHIQTIQALVAAGGGVSVLPDYTVVDPAIQTHAVEGLEFSQSIWLATRASSLEIPLVAEFRRLLIARAAAGGWS